MSWIYFYILCYVCIVVSFYFIISFEIIWISDSLWDFEIIIHQNWFYSLEQKMRYDSRHLSGPHFLLVPEKPLLALFMVKRPKDRRWCFVYVNSIEYIGTEGRIDQLFPKWKKLELVVYLFKLETKIFRYYMVKVIKFCLFFLTPFVDAILTF